MNNHYGTHSKQNNKQVNKQANAYQTQLNTLFGHYPKRHPYNSDLHLSYAPVYRNVAVHVKKGPMVVEYMDRLIEVFLKQKNECSRVFAVMVSLYFPNDWSKEKRVAKDYYSQFMDSLNAQIRHFNECKKRVGQSRNPRVRFCRVIEDGQKPLNNSGKGRGLHIHAVLFFNGHQFNNLGDFESGQLNLALRIKKAWATALDLCPAEVNYNGLVHFSTQTHPINYTHCSAGDKMKKMFTHFSYICKAYSKRYDLGIKPFSSSRG